MYQAMYNSGRILDEKRNLDPTKLLESHVAFCALSDSSEQRHAPRCHPATQRTVLRNIEEWIAEAQQRPILWLCGAGGTGKSTIARTVLDRYSGTRYCPLSFFASRTISCCMKTHSFAATIAYQVARSFPETWPGMTQVISGDPELFMRSPSLQFKALVFPTISGAQAETTIIVIDGLDEFYIEGERNPQYLPFFDELTQLAHNYPSIRILITSRSQSDIDAALERSPFSTLTTRLTLAGDATYSSDIRLFLHHRLEDLRHTRCLPSSWPASQQMSNLELLCQGSFLFADVASRFIANPSMDASRNLEAILQLSLQPDNPAKALDALYTEILGAISLDRFNVAFSALEIICLLETNHNSGSFDRMFTDITAKSPRWLEKLLHLPEGGVYEHLQTLEAVLQLPSGEDAGQVPAVLRHDSFREYLLDASRSGRFYMDQSRALLHLEMNLMKHAFIILADPHPEKGYDERAVVKMFLEGLNDSKCPASKDLKDGIEAHMSPSDATYYRYLETINMQELGNKRRIKLDELITPKEELEVLRYLQRCNTKELEPSSWRRWMNTFFLQPQISLLASALD